MDLVIKNGTVATAVDAFKADVGIQDGKIVAMTSHIDAGDTRTIDATGRLVVPGGVEVHTHIDGMLHGMRTVDDWYDASLGAAFGGTTTVVDFPMQGQDQSLAELLDEFTGRAEGKSIVDFGFTPIISRYDEQTYAEIPGLIDSGVTGFKVFMYYNWKVDDYNLARVLDVVGNRGGLISIHCENAGTIDYLAARAIEQGHTGPEWHERTRPVSTEVEATARVLAIAGELKVPVLVVHVSAGQVVEELAQARARGVMAYGETTPHFLTLDVSEYAKPGMESLKAVITPPLRPKVHQEQLWAGLRAGTLNIISSDHCAFPYKDKIRLFETRGRVFPGIPHGAPGIETRIPVVFSEGVSAGRITLPKFVEITATNPARMAGLYPRKGTLAIGSDADVTIIDPEREVTIRQDMLHGKTDYTPYEGMKVRGYPVTVISRGTILVDDGQVLARAGHGKLLTRSQFRPF